MKFGLGPVMGGAGGRLAVALLALGAARAAFAAGGSELTLFAWSE